MSRKPSGAGRSLDSWEATGLVRRFPWSFVDCLSIASGALVDTLVLAIMKGPWAHPTLADIERLAAEVKASHLLYRSLGWLERPDAFHCAPPPLTELEIGRGWRWPIRHEWLSFLRSAVALTRPEREMTRVFFDDFQTPIGAAAVDDDILQLGVVLIEHRADGLLEVARLIK